MKYCFIIFWSSWMLKIDSVLSGHESTANFHNLLLSGPVCWSQCQKVIMTLVVQTRKIKINVQGQNSLDLHKFFSFPWFLEGWNCLTVKFFKEDGCANQETYVLRFADFTIIFLKLWWWKGAWFLFSTFRPYNTKWLISWGFVLQFYLEILPLWSVEEVYFWWHK